MIALAFATAGAWAGGSDGHVQDPRMQLVQTRALAKAMAVRPTTVNPDGTTTPVAGVGLMANDKIMRLKPSDMNKDGCNLTITQPAPPTGGKGLVGVTPRKSTPPQIVQRC